MSAEKERRYQELYKNRFVNPIDHGVGRRTGWVLNKEVRKDSEGFELFDDYWSDSGDDSVDDLSLRANKENNERPYKLSLPIPHMPDFTPSSRASTDVEPLSDVGSKSTTSNSTTAKASNNTSKVLESVKTRHGITEDSTLPAEMGVASEDDAATLAMVTPNRDEGGIHESDITGSIIKGGNSFQAPNSALHEFKTKTRLSFGTDVDDAPGRQSTWKKSSREAEKPSLSDEGSASDTTLKASQSDLESEGHSTATEELPTEIPPTATEQGTSSQKELRTSVIMQKILPEAEEKTSLTEEIIPYVVEKTVDKEQADAEAGRDSSKETSDKEMTATNDSEAEPQKSTRKSTNRQNSAPLKLSTTNGHQSEASTKPTTRKTRNVTQVEEDILLSGDEGMFISLQKSFVSRHDRTKDMVSDMIKSVLGDQSFQDADDEELVIDDENIFYKSTLKTKGKSKKTAKSSSRKLVDNKKDKSLSKTKSRRGRPKKADKMAESNKDFIKHTSDEEVPSPTKEMAEPVRQKQSMKSASSESESDAKKSGQAPRPKLSRKSGKVAGSKSQYKTRSRTCTVEEPSTAGSDVDAKKGLRSRRQTTKNVKQNLTVTVSSDETVSTEIDEEHCRRKSRGKRSLTVASGSLREESAKGSGDADGDIDEDVADSKSSRIRSRSVRGKRESHSFHAQIKTVEETEPVADGNNMEENDHEGAPRNITYHEQIRAGTKPATASSSKSARKKRVSVHFSKVEVISDDISTLLDDDDEDVESTSNPKGFPSLSSQQTSLEYESDVDSSPKKKSKRTPGVKLISRRPASRSLGGKEVHKEMAQKRTIETSREDETEDITKTKKQRGSLSVRGGRVRGNRKRGGKRKEYSGDLPSSCLNDPSLVGPSSATAITNGDLSMASDLETSRANHSPRHPTSRSLGGNEMHKEMAQKRTIETSREDETEDVNETKELGGSLLVRGGREGRKRGGKRKLYSGDLPSSFLNDPSLVGPSSATAVTNDDPSMASDLETSKANHSQPVSGCSTNIRVAPVRGRGRGRRRATESVTGKTQVNREAPQEIEEPDDVVLDFLTKYESGKESESTESDGDAVIVGSMEMSQSEVGGAPSPSATTSIGMYTTVYPEPTPRSILKGSASDSGIDARKKNLTLQFFEVPRPKAFVMAPDKPEDGKRRTKRNRVRPVEFWRNERPEYQRRKSGGFVLVGVQSPKMSSPEMRPQRGGRRGKGKSKLPQTPANLSMHVSPPPGGKVAEHPSMTVINPDTQEEVEVDTLRTSKMNTFVGPSGKGATPDDPITLCKSITQKAFSSGILTIRPLSEKGMQFVQNDTMVFYITRGKVSVTIHHTTSILQNGDMFFVPQGNMYNIKNLRRDEAKLVFFQHKGRR